MQPTAPSYRIEITSPKKLLQPNSLLSFKQLYQEAKKELKSLL